MGKLRQQVWIEVKGEVSNRFGNTERTGVRVQTVWKQVWKS